MATLIERRTGARTRSRPRPIASPAKRAPGPAPDRRLRILLVTPEPPSPRARGGRPQATAATLAALADRHEVTLVTQAGGDPDDDAAIERWSGAGVRVRVARWPRPTGLDLLLRRLDLARRWILGRDPWTNVLYADPRVQTLLDHAIAAEDFDAILVEDNVMASYEYRSPAPRILTEHEVRRPRAPRWLHAIRRAGIAGILAEADWQRWPDCQRRAWSRFDRVQVLTPADQSVARSIAPDLADRLRLNPIGVEVPPATSAPPSTEATPSAHLVFVGALSHEPNVDAATWLATEIFPAIRRRRPDATLSIVGHSPPASIRSLGGDGIEVTGAVPSVEPYLSAADVVLAPVRIGGGLRTKVLEAMAHAKPIVTTTRAAEGIEIGRGAPPLIVADSPAAIAGAVKALLDDPGRRHELGARARDYVLERHSPAAYGERLEAILAELLPEPAEPTEPRGGEAARPAATASRA